MYLKLQEVKLENAKI